MSHFDCYLERCRVGSQFCETVSERCRDCRDYTEYCFKDNQHISNCSTYCYDILMQNISLQTNSSMGRCATPDDGYLSEVPHLVTEIVLGFIIIGFVVGLFVSRWHLVSEIIRRLNSILPSTEPKMVSPDEKIELSVMQPFIPLDDDNFSELHHLLIESFLVFIIIGIVVAICVFRCQLLPDIIRRISPCTEPKSVATDEKSELSVMQPFMPQGKDCQVTLGDPQVSNCGFTKHNQIPNSRKDDPSRCLSGRRENHDRTIT